MANYVDNAELYQAFIDWKAKLETNPTERMPEFIGGAIMMIAEGFTHHWRFNRYTDTWKEVMVGNAIDVCLRYVKNFDTQRYSNPHAYITMICARAFFNAVKDLKRDEALKYKYFLEHVHDGEDEDMAKLVDVAFYNDMMTKANDFEANKKIKAKKPKQAVGLSFLEDDEDDSDE